jgi:hypothetical protein
MDHSYNDECRMMGKPGDDEEDLDADELMGAEFVAQMHDGDVASAGAGGIRGQSQGGGAAGELCLCLCLSLLLSSLLLCV